MRSPDWDELGGRSIDELVTAAKVVGVGLSLMGFTTPEQWPFAIVVTVGSPGNERALRWAMELQERIRQAGPMAAGATVRRDDLETLAWMAATVHQAHHLGAAETCSRATCAAARAALGLRSAAAGLDSDG